MENEKIEIEKKEKRFILLRFDSNDELLELANLVSKKLGTSLSALCKTSLYLYCKPFRNQEVKNATAN